MAANLAIRDTSSATHPATGTGPDTETGSRQDAGTGQDIFPQRSHAVCRGIGRLFARNDIWVLPEMPLRSGRRADLMGVDARGQVIIVEIKTARSDLLGDGKWPDYLDHCDRFYWGVPPELDRAVLDTAEYRPDCCGIIVADAYDAEIVRPAPTHALSAARRKAEVQQLARAALRRLQVAGDPNCRQWGQ